MPTKPMPGSPPGPRGGSVRRLVARWPRYALGLWAIFASLLAGPAWATPLPSETPCKRTQTCAPPVDRLITEEAAGAQNSIAKTTENLSPKVKGALDSIGRPGTDEGPTGEVDIERRIAEDPATLENQGARLQESAHSRHRTIHRQAPAEPPATKTRGGREHRKPAQASASKAGAREERRPVTDQINALPDPLELAGDFAFPLTLSLIVGGFLLVQGRIDRKDPKLALAPVTEDMLRFE